MPAYPVTFNYSVDDVVYVLNTTDYSIKRGVVLQLELNAYTDGAGGVTSSKKYRIELDGDDTGTVYVMESYVYADYATASVDLEALITA